MKLSLKSAVAFSQSNIYPSQFPPSPPPDCAAVCSCQVAGRRGVFGPPPTQPLEIKRLKSPTVNIGLASATGRLGLGCAKVTLTVSSTALPSLDSVRSPNRRRVLCARWKDIVRGPLREQEQRWVSPATKRNAVAPVIRRHVGTHTLVCLLPLRRVL